ncbi:hypothetical protein [Phocaeicola paurosaccharolyticus]|uniref:hypothetical protein n=1 Tax=Phocaeicola paurosaccharolyticus TaxID=732242 RepID=UPI000AD41424|nr:hypothetical protein [Phocaeicola paurosaccharolyticus]
MNLSPYTDADNILLGCLQTKVNSLRKNICNGRPYVWKLRLSLGDFCTLESAIQNSMSSHNNDYHHLLSEDFAVIIVIYLAEWYKRFYNGSDTMDENKVLSLTSKELERIYDLAGIDKNTFVYNASKNPDKTSYRWLESLQVLGGLAVNAELKRDQTDALLPQLCKIFHGEELELDDIKDRNRAVAFQESILRQHSLYDYLDCILDKAKEPPFAPSDIRDESTMIPELIKRIENADRQAKRDKFDFEWIIAYTAKSNQMVRMLRVRLKPEIIGGGRKQYIGYDRLRQPEWGVEHPEEVGRIELFLRFKEGNHYIREEGKWDDPIFKYDNTGCERTGFLSVNKMDENTFTNVPANRFDKVEMVMKYGDKAKIVQTLEVPDYMQVYSIPKSCNKFTSRRNSQTATVVIFSSDYHLADDYKDIPVVYAHYRNGEQISEEYCWCPINDKVVIADYNGKEILPPFFNRNGLYQVVTRKYLKTIKYRDNVFVLYQYIDADMDEEEYTCENIPVLFGRNGLKVLHFDSGQSKEGSPVNDYDLEWMKENKYVDWKTEEPSQGAIRLRVTVKGIVFKPRVYYVPFAPADTEEAPIWRDFEYMRIRTSLEGVEDIQDSFVKQKGNKESSTKQLTIGNEDSKILIDVYRPIILRELSQKKDNSEDSQIVEFAGKNDAIHIPLINCEQFSLRDFSENGVREYQINCKNTVYYNFMTIDRIGLNISSYTQEESISRLTPEIPLDYLKIYITKAMDSKVTNLYAWNYKDDPKAVDCSNELKEAGIVYQSLKDNNFPRHYACPTFKTDDDDDWWDDDDANSKDEIYVLKCFETISEHKTYFFLFEPMLKTISSRNQIKDIILPLIVKRNYELTDKDVKNLYRFAIQFHFDWMLLPRDLWNDQIEQFTKVGEQRALLKDAIIRFFRTTPKCTDEREAACLKEFLSIYWTFNSYPNELDNVAKAALNLIKDNPDALTRFNSLKDFLIPYDECRYKYSEMCKAITSETDNE